MARLACDGTRILVARPIIAPPQRPVPPAPTREVLDEVAALMRGRPRLQLVRIEAYSSHDPGARHGADAARRSNSSQARADAVFRYLWQIRGDLAGKPGRRGYGYRPAFRGAEQRWPIVLYVAQRRGASNPLGMRQESR